MRRRRWWMMLIASLLLVWSTTACGSDEPVDNDDHQQNQNNDVEDPPDSLEERCEAACARIYDESSDEGCDTRFSDEDGAVSQGRCVDGCTDDNLFRGGEWCVAVEAECSTEPEEMIEACLPDDYHVEACDHLGLWSRDHVEVEEEIVDYVNDHRTEGVECPTGDFGAVEPLEFNPELQCAARLYSWEWVEEDDDDHPGLLLDVDEAQQRAEDAGYEGQVVGVIPNHGEHDADQLISQWLDGDGECERMMDEDAREIGFGYYEQQRGTAFFGTNN